MKNDNHVFSSYTIVDKIKTKGSWLITKKMIKKLIGSNTQPFGTITEEKEELNCNKIDEIYQFLGDIEKDFKVSNGNPNTIEVTTLIFES